MRYSCPALVFRIRLTPYFGFVDVGYHEDDVALRRIHPPFSLIQFEMMTSTTFSRTGGWPEASLHHQQQAEDGKWAKASTP